MQLQAMAATKQVLESEDLWYCTANKVGGENGCDGECVAVLVIAGITLLLALYDGYMIQSCMKHLIAPRRHLVVMFLAVGMYACLNGMSALFPGNFLLWGGLMNFLRIFFVYHYTLYLLSVLFIDGYGDYEELVEKCGVFLSKHPEVGGGRGAAWVESCLFKVRVWMVEVIISYICKTVADTHLVYIAMSPETKRVMMWDGAMIYIGIVDILFTLVCGIGVSQLAGVIRPMLHPDMKTLVSARHMLFLFFYLIIALVYPTVIQFAFAAMIDLPDDQYFWWNEHKAMFVATHMILFQYGMHVAFVPPYQFGFARAQLLEIKSKLRSRKDVPAFLDELAARGYVLSTAMERSLPAMTPAAMQAAADAQSTGADGTIGLADVQAGIIHRASKAGGGNDVYDAQFRSLALAEGGQLGKTPSHIKPAKTEHVVADAVFDKVAGQSAESIDQKALSRYLVDRGDVPLEEIQQLFSALDTDKDGKIDREEWRVGFTAGLLNNKIKKDEDSAA